MKSCQALVQDGHQVHLLVPRQTTAHGGFSADQLSSYYGLANAFPVTWLPSHPSLRRYDFSWQAVRLAKKHNASLVYVWLFQAAVFALPAGLPVILEMHGPPEGVFGPLLFRLFLRLPGRKRLLPITQALAQRLSPYGFASTADIHTNHVPAHVPSMVISPNGVDLERFQGLPEPTAARQELRLPQKFTVGYTGHLYSGRGITLLMELARRFPDLHFLWVGGRPGDVESWRNRLTSEAIANVTLTGFVDNSLLPRYQAAADILLMPYERSIAGSSGGNSAEYASPMKMFEYMACGRAILSSDLPVIGEVLNEANAVLCPPEDLESWSTALSELAANPAKCAVLARQALLDVQQFTWLRRAQRALAGFI